ncbi:hypothetical protein VFPBJ_08200 [Purpureocillium lilacinum]|uniref:Uncharacterized protein n=1 Tax=Purpureocillium lilacinum TaxID=33203 RepID=A0A179GJP5_PURLI|nr:hypothetical protein VFPBJ_08200 [Purpureocillium lilacinum]
MSCWTCAAPLARPQSFLAHPCPEPVVAVHGPCSPHSGLRTLFAQTLSCSSPDPTPGTCSRYRGFLRGPSTKQSCGVGRSSRPTDLSLPSLSPSVDVRNRLSKARPAMAATGMRTNPRFISSQALRIP